MRVMGFNSFTAMSCRTPPESRTPFTPLSLARARALSRSRSLPRARVRAVSLSATPSLCRCRSFFFSRAPSLSHTHILFLSLSLALFFSHALPFLPPLLPCALPPSFSFGCKRIQLERHAADSWPAGTRVAPPGGSPCIRAGISWMHACRSEMQCMRAGI